MQLQHADPHDTIAAQLRASATHRASNLSESNVAPAPEPENEPPLHATPLNDNTGDIRILTPHARSGRGVVFLAICAAGAAATMAWHFYGDQAKQRLSDLIPQLLTDAPAPTQSANAAEPQDVPSQTAPPEPAAAQAPTQESSDAASATPIPAPPAPAPATPAAETSPTQAALPPELTQSLETMAQEIASLKQTVEQLRSGQQRLSDDVAKVAEQGTRPKLAEKPSKPASRQRPRHASTPAAASRAAVTYSPPQTHSQRQTYPQGIAQREAYTAPRQGIAQREAYTAPPAPTQLPPPPGDSSVPRPPMPLQ